VAASVACTDVLSLRSVSYRYAGMAEASLSGVDLDLGNGEVIGVVGANETGKSTLCLVASGLAPRTIRGHLTGQIIIDGEDSRGWPVHRVSSHVGIAFQNPGTQLSGIALTVFEEVAFGPANLGLPRDEIVGRTESALDALGIEHLAGRDPRRLSGGQIQLVALAGTMAMGPRHLILDEPTAQLDPVGTALVAEAIARLAGAGTSILVAEHKTDLLATLCGRIAVLEGGRIVSLAPAHAVLTDDRLEKWGVRPPARVRLGRALARAGIDPGAIEPALDESAVSGGSGTT